jgi:hypothetical protein
MVDGMPACRGCEWMAMPCVWETKGGSHRSPPASARRAGHRARAYAADLTRHATALLRQNLPGPHTQHHTPLTQPAVRPRAFLFTVTTQSSSFPPRSHHHLLAKIPIRPIQWPPPPPRDPDKETARFLAFFPYRGRPLRITGVGGRGTSRESRETGSVSWQRASERATHRHQLPERGG